MNEKKTIRTTLISGLGLAATLGGYTKKAVDTLDFPFKVVRVFERYEPIAGIATVELVNAMADVLYPTEPQPSIEAIANGTPANLPAAISVTSVSSSTTTTPEPKNSLDWAALGFTCHDLPERT